MLNKEELPLFSRIIVEEILLNRMPENNYWYYFLLVQYMISKVLCSNRVTIKSEKIGANTSPNIYALLFSDSGNGKDRSYQIVKDCMKEYNLDIAMRAIEYTEIESEKVEKYITINNLTKSQATQYRQEHSPRFLLQEIDSNATLEGYIEARLALQQANFGCSCWEDSEIFDTIRGLSRGDKGTKALLTYNKEAFDNGNNKAKIIKGNKKPQTINGVPHLVCLHGAVDEGEEVDDFLKGFFDFGFARRSLLFYDDNSFAQSVEVTDAMLQEAIKIEKYAIQIFKELNDKFKPFAKIQSPYDRILIIPDKEVENRYFEYELLCKNDSKKYTGRHRKGVKIEVANRPWKALKLAVVLFCQDITGQEREKEYTMPVSYFSLAEKIVALYGDYFRSFYLKEGVCLEKQVADFILGSTSEVYKSTIVSAKFLKGTYQQRLGIVDQLIEKGRLSDYLSSQGRKLVLSEGGKTKKSIFYTIEEDIKEPETDKTPEVISFSQSNTNLDTETNFYKKECAFFDLHKYIQEDKNYNPSCFNGNYRRSENWDGKNNMIVLDCDNEVEQENEQLTIAKAQELLKDYTYLIMPTKSHLKEKKGLIRERFRIIFPTNTLVDVTQEDYKDILRVLVKRLKLDFSYSKKINGKDVRFSWIDTSCFEVSKKYHGYNSEPHYNTGELLNWKNYYTPKKIVINKNTDKTFKNPFDKNTVLEIKGTPMLYPEYLFEAKSKNRPIPCKCPFHEDKNPSAFISVNKHGDFQFTCIPCNISQFCEI